MSRRSLPVKHGLLLASLALSGTGCGFGLIDMLEQLPVCDTRTPTRYAQR
jgi:hypothetical protein